MAEVFESKPPRTPLERFVSALSEHGVMFREGAGGIPEFEGVDFAASLSGCQDPMHEHIVWGAMMTAARERPPAKLAKICRNCGNDDWEKGADPCPKCGTEKPVKVSSGAGAVGWMDDPHAWHHRQRLVTKLHEWGWAHWAVARHRDDINVLLHARLAGAAVKEYCEFTRGWRRRDIEAALEVGRDRWERLVPHYRDLTARLHRVESEVTRHIIERLRAGEETMKKS